MRGERPGADLLVGLHTTAHAIDEGTYLTHATPAQNGRLRREGADRQRQCPVHRGPGDGDRGVLVDFGDVGENQVDDFRAHGLAEVIERRVLGEQVDDGKAGLLRVADGTVDGREIAGRCGRGRALAAGRLGARGRWGGSSEVRGQRRGWVVEGVAGRRLPIPVQESDAGGSCDHDEDNQIGGRCGDDGRRP